MLETARRKFLDPDEAIRREALEKLWDAFERIKTVGPGTDKAAKAEAMLDRMERRDRTRNHLGRYIRNAGSANGSQHILDVVLALERDVGQRNHRNG